MRSELEVADIFRCHGPAYRRAHDGHIGRVERRVMSAIELCRTAALGGHVEACEDCAHSRVAYNSCRNRHCPKCQSATRERWLADRQADLLPVPYFHVVFTIPAEVAAICPPTVTPRDRETAAAKSLTGVPVSTAMWPAKTARIGNSRRPSACPD